MLLLVLCFLHTGNVCLIDLFCNMCMFWVCLGLSDIPGEAMVKLYCPKCMDVYTPKSSRHHHTDGAYFGTGFPHMLFMVHPEYRPKRPANQFVPRFVFFFCPVRTCPVVSLRLFLNKVFLSRSQARFSILEPGYCRKWKGTSLHVNTTGALPEGEKSVD